MNYNKIPKDIELLTKDETELRAELINVIEAGEDHLERLSTEFKRLRREHFENEERIARIQASLKDQTEQLKQVLER